MTNIWVWADQHLGHKNILTFTDHSRELIRGKIFKTIEEHDERIITNHNDLVRPEDHVYWLGDIVINKHFLRLIPRFTGHKRLVLGNHDIYPIQMYLDVGFEKVYGVRVWPKQNIIFSHIPLHPGSLESRGWTNIHGHLHSGIVTDINGHPDFRYRCVSLEHTDYKPLLMWK